MWNNIYIGKVSHYEEELLKENPWAAWFSSDEVIELVGLYATEKEAREAIEEKLDECLCR